MPEFTLPEDFDLSDHFDHRTLTRAIGLQPERALLSQQVHGDELQTRVRGSGSQVYEQDIRFYVDARTGLHLRGACSCPVGLNCKHVAAALMAFEARELRAKRPGAAQSAAADTRAAANPVEAEFLPRALENWLVDWPAAARLRPAPGIAAGAGQATGAASPRVLLYVLVVDGTRLLLRLLQGSLRRNGEVGSHRPHSPTVTDMMRSRPAYVSEADEALFAALLPFTVNRQDIDIELRGPTAAATVRLLLLSGRCWFGAAPGSHGELLPTPPGPPARWRDAPQPLRLQWHADEQNVWRPRWEAEAAAEADGATPVPGAAPHLSLSPEGRGGNSGDAATVSKAVSAMPAESLLTPPGQPAALVLLPSPHAVDLPRACLGPAVLCGPALPEALLAWLMRMPPVSAAALPLLVKRLQMQGVAHGIELPLPPALAQPVQELGALVLQPVLRLVTCPNVPAESWLEGHQRPLPAGQPARQAALQLLLRYGPAAGGGSARQASPVVEFNFPAGASDIAFVERPDPQRRGASVLSRFRRDAVAEAAAAQKLFTQLDLRPWSRVAGFVLERLAALRAARAQSAALPPGLEDAQLLLLPVARTQWPLLLSQHIPALQASGWVVERADDFPYQVFDADDFELSIATARGGKAGVAEAGEGADAADLTGQGEWFKVGLKVSVGGEPVDLLPLLVGLVQAGWLAQGNTPLQPGTEVLVPWPEAPAGAGTGPGSARASGPPRERLLRLGADRVAPLVAWLRGVFGKAGASAAKAGLQRVSRFELGALEGLGAAIAVKAPPALTELMDQLRSLRTGEGLPAVAVSPNVQAQLRPYQLDGLAWMDFLRRAHFGGVLADDMGLGKTLQTLALLQAELDAGRLDRPSLVVVPTSLLGNWQAEAARFTPQLRTLVLHGKQRGAQFRAIAEAQLVVTSYPLAVRDAAVLAAQPWHYLILDEAQRIKNSRSQAALALKGLTARHRLCLSGTPLENHLGELWSLMDFVSPGLLGSEAQFREHYRNPVEKRQDMLQAEQLARRVRPFILRRTKAQVARDLPEKTETLLRVDLEGTQRDLYETVRATMDGKLRDAIAKQGLARSQIVVLDALLKLRQVCCDPRLLKAQPLPDEATPQRHHAPSAKLELLLDLLPTLVEDGRRILVFSQFTEMLALIEPELVRLKLEYLKLTGDTQDRAGLVAEFQTGDAPIFLISLKAGGVGLNLTAADTVILYDPWWNPAVEQQAIDRAYRIGQDKPVFVYKLVASGTVEDKMLELQARKAGLADALLKGVASDAALTAQDFDELFKPLLPA